MSGRRLQNRIFSITIDRIENNKNGIFNHIKQKMKHDPKNNLMIKKLKKIMKSCMEASIKEKNNMVQNLF